MIYNFKLIIK